MGFIMNLAFTADLTDFLSKSGLNFLDEEKP